MYKIVQLTIMQFYPIKKFTSVLVVMMLVILLSSNETASSFPAGLLVSLHDVPDCTQ
jgi:hypothetical protein